MVMSISMQSIAFGVPRFKYIIAFNIQGN